ncbi:MAG: glycosyltransferase family 2 protein, partial [Sandaracinaceae bacterium]|nr:glycosyltransferase family 2 protein [Sandaracinaceae bacterium]
MNAGPSAFRPCVVIPSYNNPVTIRRVVLAVRAYVPDVIVVDD